MKHKFKGTAKRLKDELGTTYRIEFPEVRINQGESVTIRINWLTGEVLLWEHGRLWTAIVGLLSKCRKFLKGLTEKRRDLIAGPMSINERVARNLLEATVAEMKYPFEAVNIPLTDIECRRIALNFPYSLREIRRMFPVRKKEEDLRCQ